MSSCFVRIHSEQDIYLALRKVRALMDQLSFSEMNQQKVIVAVSELTRNILDHTDSGGDFSCEITAEGALRISIEDRGGGIPDVDRILRGEHVAHRRGLGLGLAGAKRMMDEFQITTSKEGTKIVCIQWKEGNRIRPHVRSPSFDRSDCGGHRP